VSKGFHHLTKEKKIIYLIWLDRTVLELWSGYLDIWTDNKLSFDEKETKTKEKKLLIDHFETICDQIMSEVSYAEVDKFRVDNSKICETVGYDWSRLWYG